MALISNSMLRFICFFIISFFALGKGYPQQYNFSNYSINDGLSQSVVNCIHQDSRGYIWIGTQNGLNKFDGVSFEVYRFNPMDSTSISNNWVYSISEDNEGDLWIGTKGGLNKYLFKQNIFERITYQANFDYNITQYCYDNICLGNGNVLINTPPILTIYNTKEKSFKHFKSKIAYDGSVKDVKIPLLKDDDYIWIGSTKGLSRFSLKTNLFNYYSFASKKGKSIENINITELFKDSNGTLWAGTTSGLFNYNSKTNQFEKYSFKECCIRTIVEDKNKNLIIGTEGNGLVVISPDSRNNIQNYTSQNSTIAHNIVQSLIIDKSDNLWIGTLSGISKTDLKNKKFKLYRNSNSPNSINLLDNVIASIFKNDDSTLWVGNWGQGLNLINLNTNEVEHFSTQQQGNHKITNDFIHVIFKDSDDIIWLGTRDGIHIYDKPSNKFIPWHKYFKNPALQRFNNIRIYKIIQDQALNYWIGTQNGLYKVSPDKSQIEVFKAELNEDHRISANLIYCILEDSDGLIWIATVSGLDVYNPITKKIRHFVNQTQELNGNYAISICEDSKRRIWIGTGSYVNMYNKEDSTFTYYNHEHGLPNNNIFEIVKDKNDDLWFATGKGLCKFIEKQNRFHTFTLEDGLQSLEFNLRAAYVCDDGEMFIGGMNGFNSFYPDSLYKNPHEPNLVFTSFYKTEGSEKEYLNIEESRDIKLNHKVKTFTIEFAALEYTNPQKNNYAYKMVGVSDKWTNIGNRQFVPFFALKPGDYTFMIKGSNNDGVWNNNAESINITILPPWWRSKYAYISYLTAILLAVVLFINMRERKLKQDKKILEKKVLERTLQIEEQNHLITSQNQELKKLNDTKDKFFSIIGHDLGNHFNIIVGFSESLILDHKKLSPEKTQYHLNNIYNSSKHASELLDNLLTWSRLQRNSIKFLPTEFNINEKIDELLDFHKEASEKKKISINLSASKEITIHADENMFSTIFRNLVANAIKYTNEKGLISIDIQEEKDHCRISVKDSGIGISTEELDLIFQLDGKHSTPGTHGEKGTGLGLILCKEFTEKHNGKIWVESETGKGSEFIFTMPLKEKAQEANLFKNMSVFYYLSMISLRI